MKIYYNAPYEVVITVSPSSARESAYGCYGIKNVETGVIEGYIGQLARAIMTADQFAKELKEGLKSDKDAALELLSALNKTSSGGWDGNGSPLN